MWKIETDTRRSVERQEKKHNYVNVSAQLEGAPLKSPGATVAKTGGDGQTGGQEGGGMVGQTEGWVERDR